MEAKWSVKMADCVLAQRPALNYQRWSYDNGVVMKGLISLWKKSGENKYFDFCKAYMEEFIYENGMIRDYRPYEYNIDLINNGKILFEMYRVTEDEKYKKAIFKLRNQLYKHPRTKEGALWHKKIYKDQVWLDGLYMEAPFYAEFVKEFDFKKNYNDIVRQFLLCRKYMRDSETGLYYHAWDESHSEFWCDRKSGLSRNFWGRAMGWLVMALADVLEIIPKDQKDRLNLEEMLFDCLEALFKVQDKTGCWYQVLDMGGRKGNYLEASCSCMILYAAVKAFKLDIIDGEFYKEAIENAYNGIIDEFILISDGGFINLNKNCAVAGLGGRNKRDGSFAYYISEPVTCNDLKGVGAFIQAMLEYEDYKNLQRQKKFIDLLLLADEQENMIDKYLNRGDLFALYDDDLKGICVVTCEGGGICELKNIAVYEKYQNRGYGKALINFILDYYGKFCCVMYVGTGDSMTTVPFYESCGFVYSHKVKNFFADNYNPPIIENGIMLTDMIYLKKFCKSLSKNY